MYKGYQNNADQNGNIKTRNISPNYMAHFEYVRVTLTYKNCMQEEISSTSNSRNAYRDSGQMLLSYSLPSKILMTGKYRTIT